MVGAREYHERTKLSLTEEVPDTLVPDRDPETQPTAYKQYVGQPTVDLSGIRPPAIPALSAVAHADAGPVSDAGMRSPEMFDRETVGTLCYEAAGVTQSVTRDGERVTFRAASCTGRLYHVNLYLVCGDLTDLSAGVYHFDPTSFALDELREGDYRGWAAAATGQTGDHAAGNADAGDESGATPETPEAATTGVEDAPVTAVLTSQWWRNAWKYGDRTYRHAFWDAGTITANLLAAAHALDRRASVVCGFADREVATLVGVDPAEEAPIAVVPLGSGDPAPPPPPARSRAAIDPETAPVGERTRRHTLIREAWEESAFADGETATEWRRACRETGPVGPAAAGDGERVALDPVDAATASSRPLHATILRRGSCREFATVGPTRRQVGTVLDRATRGVPGVSGPTVTGLAYNDLHVLTTGVDGVRDGHYRYHPDRNDLERLGETSPERKQRLALGQGWAGEAHVNVYSLADLDALTDRLGDRGYRLAQLEAGVTLGRLYLATYAHRDLGGTGLTFADDEVTSHCDPEGGRTPTCLFAFGRRAD